MSLSYRDIKFIVVRLHKNVIYTITQHSQCWSEEYKRKKMKKIYQKAKYKKNSLSIIEF